MCSRLLPWLQISSSIRNVLESTDRNIQKEKAGQDVILGETPRQDDDDEGTPTSRNGSDCTVINEFLTIAIQQNSKYGGAIMDVIKCGSVLVDGRMEQRHRFRSWLGCKVSRSRQQRRGCYRLQGCQDCFLAKRKTDE